MAALNRYLKLAFRSNRQGTPLATCCSHYFRALCGRCLPQYSVHSCHWLNCGGLRSCVSKMSHFRHAPSSIVCWFSASSSQWKVSNVRAPTLTALLTLLLPLLALRLLFPILCLYECMREGVRVCVILFICAFVCLFVLRLSYKWWVN